MVETVLIFPNFLSLVELVDRVKGKLDWPDSVLRMHMEGVVDVGSSKGPRTKTFVPLSLQPEWEIYRDIVMASEVHSLCSGV